MHFPIRLFVALLLGILLQTSLTAADAETEIEGLLTRLGDMKGATFIRNGSVHTPKEAVAHLRLKWSKQKERIHTAEDFIEWCGTKSSTTGEPYRIRLADGSEQESAVFLHHVLERIRSEAQTESGTKP